MSNEGYVIPFQQDKSIRNPELLRLQEQGGTLTDMIERVPPAFDKPKGTFIDLACGAGDWVLRMAKEYPQAARIVGIDIFKEAVAYANAEALTQQANAEFYEGDITKPQPFSDESFDLVNSRFIAGILPGKAESYIAFTTECYRLCRRDGWLQMTEAEFASIPGCPATHQMIHAEMKVLYMFGKCFSEYEMAVTPQLETFMKDAGFVDTKRYTYSIDFSPSSKAHESLIKDFLMVPQLLKQPLVKAFGGEQEFEDTYSQMQQELHAPDLKGLWFITRVTGRKPA